MSLLSGKKGGFSFKLEILFLHDSYCSLTTKTILSNLADKLIIPILSSIHGQQLWKCLINLQSREGSRENGQKERNFFLAENQEGKQNLLILTRKRNKLWIKSSAKLGGHYRSAFLVLPLLQSTSNSYVSEWNFFEVFSYFSEVWEYYITKFEFPWCS